VEERLLMIALDTNTLVHFLVDDDPVQADIANVLVNHPNGIFIAKTTLLELEWVLHNAYQIDNTTLATGFPSLPGLPNWRHLDEWFWQHVKRFIFQTSLEKTFETASSLSLCSQIRFLRKSDIELV
jgi:hypothetical protein